MVALPLQIIAGAFFAATFFVFTYRFHGGATEGPTALSSLMKPFTKAWSEQQLLTPPAKISPLILNLEARDKLSLQERQILEAGFSRQRELRRNEDIVREGDFPSESCVMLSGLSARYHLLDDGSRQISAVHLAGDFVDLHGLLLHPMDHSVGALTDCTVAFMPHEYVCHITETQPHLTRLLWLSTLIDAAIHRRWLMASGRLPALGRVAHFMCEMFVRMRVVGLASGQSFNLPINQTVLGDAMGLSLVHVNRTLQEMRKQRLITWHGETLTILDWKNLQEVASFDPGYLNLLPQPR